MTLIYAFSFVITEYIIAYYIVKYIIKISHHPEHLPPPAWYSVDLVFVQIVVEPFVVLKSHSDHYPEIGHLMNSFWHYSWWSLGPPELIERRHGVPQSNARGAYTLLWKVFRNHKSVLHSTFKRKTKRIIRFLKPTIILYSKQSTMAEQSTQSNNLVLAKHEKGQV